MTDVRPAGAFSGWERSIAARYLRTKKKDGGVALISIISFVGITLAVAVLIIVMSVMNGFRTELMGRILGFNGHVYVGGPLGSWDEGWGGSSPPSCPPVGSRAAPLLIRR